MTPTHPTERELLARLLFDYACQNPDDMDTMAGCSQSYESWEAAKTFAHHLIASGWVRREVIMRGAARALRLAREALLHDVPGSCWATGPLTGDPVEDLVVCPGCRALDAIDTALTPPKGGE